MTSGIVLDDLDLEGRDFAVDDDPNLHATLAELRSRKPYAVVPFGSGRAVVLLTEELVLAAFQDEKTFPSYATYQKKTVPVFGQTLQSMEGREHRTSKAMLSRPFRPKAAAALAEPLIAPVAHQVVDAFVDRGRADLVAEFTSEYPLRIMSALLGQPADDVAKMKQWAYDLFTYPYHPEQALRAAKEYTDYILPVLAERRADPADDLISKLVTESVEGEALADDQILSFLRHLFPAGSDTTYLAVGSAIAALLSNPDQFDILRANPEEELRWTVAEALRWEPPVGLLPRFCPQAVTWHGIDIPADTPVVFAVTAANRDPAKYPDPDRFDITRRVMPATTFGGGPHGCLGNWLALVEMETALKVLIERLPGLRLQEGAKAEVTSMLTTALRGPKSLLVEWDS